jgi:hypothetical protein
MEKEKENPLWLSPLVPDGDVTVEFRVDHVHIKLGEGLKVSAEQRNLLWERIARICEEHGSRRILVEGKVPKGIFETSEVIDAGLKAATVPKLWMAFCFKDHKPDELGELYETVAASRGVRVKHFSNTNSALQWLRVNTPD